LDPRVSRLRDHLPTGEPCGAEAALERFLAWLEESEIDPYPAQQEAFLELCSDRHVILGTPTGSGKSLAAAFLHFRAMAEWQRSFYACPTKALTSEKFFWLCEQFGAAEVGMLTGDASINSDAPIVCCTTEVLAQIALRQGEAATLPYAVLDEFHYYGDRERGMAFQVPLLELPRTQFLLMSATLGDPSDLSRALEERSGREVACVFSDQRPVPLDFAYRETPIQETVEALLDEGRAPLYLVHFTQREAAEQAQGLCSARIASREERQTIARAIGDFRFDTPYGKDVRRMLQAGIGLHHAGLLPKYRLLVEQLSQRGLLKVICGTDTLGVGVNIPIRTVVFTSLAKYDGEKVGILRVREFKQIAGRAGRKGFDEQGSVVCQAPPHVSERRRRAGRSKGPAPRAPRGLPVWNKDTFQRLVYRPPEPLEPQFRITHGIMVPLLQREPEAGGPAGYGAITKLCERAHTTAGRRRRLLRDAARVFRSLRRAGIVTLAARSGARAGRSVRVDPELQLDFSLHHTLSLYLIDAVAVLDREAESYPLEVLSLIEAILEDPVPVLVAQRERRRRELLAALKAEGVPFEERIERLDQVDYPRPETEFLEASLAIFAREHPWVDREDLSPKSIAREMFEGWTSFNDYVRDYALGRSEGRLLRYLGDVYRTLVQNVPEPSKTAEVYDVCAYLRATLERVDKSLLTEWERMVQPTPFGVPAAAPVRPADALARDPRAFEARVRAELHRLVRALSQGAYEEAVLCVRADARDDWDAARFEEALEPFFAEHGGIEFSPRARLSEHTQLRRLGPGLWSFTQVLLDPEEENLWCLEGRVDLRDGELPEGALLTLERIGR
jgi:superfamily II RNA helicase